MQRCLATLFTTDIGIFRAFGTEHNMPQDPKSDHISVCICTFKRPEMLAKALEGIISQVTTSEFSYEVVVVDNDSRRSAEDTVRRFQSTNELKIIYDCEPEQNISLTRNRAICNTTGNLVAFMDDDEFPCDDWLIRLYLACQKYKADGVLGPVKPFFAPDTPSWLKRSRLCERPSHKSGTVLNHLQTRTGNVLFKRSILEGTDAPFPPEMGRTGGEDIEFFKRMIASGYIFVWCEEAPVYENILPERFTRIYYIDRSLRIGGLTGEMMKDLGLEKWKCILRSGCAAVFYSLGAAAGLLLGPHIYMRNLVRVVYHLGRMSGCFGFVPVRERRER